MNDVSVVYFALETEKRELQVKLQQADEDRKGAAAKEAELIKKVRIHHFFSFHCFTHTVNMKSTISHEQCWCWFLRSAMYKSSYLLTYLLTWCMGVHISST